MKVTLDLLSFQSHAFDPNIIEDLQNITIDSINTWNSVGANIKLYWGGLHTVNRDDNNNIVIIGSPRPRPDWPFHEPADAIGYTTDYPRDTDLPIIKIFRRNEDGIIPWSFINLRAVILHELGHALGLGHDCSGKESLMKVQKVTNTGEVWFPRKVDIDDLVNIYGRKQYSFEIFKTKNTDVWQSVSSNLGNFGNVFTSRPFSVVGSGSKVKYRDRLVFYTDSLNRPSYVLSSNFSDGTVSDSFDSASGSRFSQSFSLAGTTAATDGKGEYMIGWLEQGADDGRHIRVRHNASNLDRKLWVDVDPGLCCNLASSAPAVAHIEDDTWVLFVATGTDGQLGYFVTHDDGNTWRGSSDPNLTFARAFTWSGEALGSATRVIDVEYNESEGLIIAFAYRKPNSTEIGLIPNYTPVVIYADLLDNEITPRKASWQVELSAVNSKLSVESNSEILVEAFLDEKDTLTYRLVEDFGFDDTWSAAITIENTGMDPELSANTGLTLADCQSIDMTCVKEAQRADHIFMYRLIDDGSAGSGGDKNSMDFSNATTIERSPYAHLANADYEIIPRPRNEWPNGGICADIIVTNNSEETVRPWTIAIEGVMGEVFDFWNAEWVQHGNTVVATPANWANWPNCCNLGPGRETDKSHFGFCSSSNEFEDPSAIPLPGEELAIDIYDRFNSGYCAHLTVKNTESYRGEWDVEFDVLGEFYNVWNMQITSDPAPSKSNWRTVRAKGLDWNKYLGPGELTHGIGFCVRNNFGGSNQPM